MNHFSEEWLYFGMPTEGAKSIDSSEKPSRTYRALFINPEDPSILRLTICPACHKATIEALWNTTLANTVAAIVSGESTSQRKVQFWPKQTRARLPPEVPAEYADDYNEACLVLADSPKASAALGRRCLQHLIRKKAGIKKNDLASEIQELLNTGALPAHIAENVDAIRQFGNFAAHPIEDQQTGAIVPVQPAEAEWTLDVLEQLFDFYFVQPAQDAQKRAALNAKLQAAGKRPMK